MEKRIIILLFAFLITCLMGCKKETAQQFTNPILAGFYPDPSICKVGDDYYLTTSTFTYYPGLPIFHSRDLVNWKLIRHVINKPEILDVDGDRVSRGLFAPAIRYHDGLFYVTCTLIDKGGNFISTATNPAGPWSDQIWIPEVDGIDPSPFFDEDGRAYLIYNSVAPDNKPLYQGHRTIRLREWDKDSLKVIGEEIIIVNGGVDISKNPVWIEAPHIFRKDGWYYLICAEGGTAYQHSEVVFRSESVRGPYVPYDKNPILTQRHLDPGRPNPITTTGHADFVETKNGDWWAVFLGCRPYADKDYYNIGRETFLAPVRWTDGWPIINLDFEEVQYRYDYPLAKDQEKISPLSGNFVYRDDFESDSLAIEWMFLRAPKSKWYAINEGSLTLQLRPETCIEQTNPSFIGHRQQHISSSATVSLKFVPEADNEKAGLLIYQSENNFYYICQSLEHETRVIQLYQAPVIGDTIMTLVASREIENSATELQLRIESSPSAYSFSYATTNGDWNVLKPDMDPKFLSTKVAGGFVGSVFAMYATSQGIPSNSAVSFDWFEYEGHDTIFESMKKPKTK